MNNINKYKIFLLLLYVIFLSGCFPIISWPEKHARVIDIETQKPLQGVIVVARWKGTAGSIEPHDTCYHVESTSTDSDGRFTIPSYIGGVRQGFVASKYVSISFFKKGYWEYAGLDGVIKSEPYDEEKDYWPYKKREDYYLTSFKGTRKERLKQLRGVSCYSAGKSEKNLLLMRKVLYEEAKALADETEEDDKIVERFLHSLEIVQYGYETAARRDRLRSKIRWPEKHARVLDIDTQEPLQGVFVVARWKDKYGACYRVESTSTDRNGQFTIPGFVGGTRQGHTDSKFVTIKFYKDGYYKKLIKQVGQTHKPYDRHFESSSWGEKVGRFKVPGVMTGVTQNTLNFSIDNSFSIGFYEEGYYNKKYVKPDGTILKSNNKPKDFLLSLYAETRERRLGYLLGIRNAIACYYGKYRFTKNRWKKHKELLPILKALHEEAKAIAQTNKDKRIVNNILHDIELIELSYEEATKRDLERRSVLRNE